MDDHLVLRELSTPATTTASGEVHQQDDYRVVHKRLHLECDDKPWSFLPAVISAAIAALVVLLAFILISTFQPSPSWVVDIDNCTCDCWDRAFKVRFLPLFIAILSGNYGHGGYKHVYFQLTRGSALLWLWSAAHFIMLLKFVERATSCVLGSFFFPRSVPRIRWPVLFLSCINFYGMFYNWWTTFNYINDAGLKESYHILLPTQIFFNFTDIIPAITLYRLLPSNPNSKCSSDSLPIPITHSHNFSSSTPAASITSPSSLTPASPMLLFAALTISASHLLLSLVDQGFAHLLTLRGPVVRDLMFIFSDLAAVLVFAWFLHPRLKHSVIRNRLIVAIAVLSASYLLLKHWAGYR